MSELQTIKEYQEFCKDIIDKNPNMNESETKLKIINNLIDVLGWDRIDDVKMEYSIQMGSNKKHVDYSMNIKNEPKVFVEAKSLASRISTGNKNQLKSYMRQENVNWGLLTNGEEYHIMKREFNNKKVEIKVVVGFNIEESRKDIEYLNLLNKESIESGRSNRVVEKIQSQKKIKERLRKDKGLISEEITELLEKRSYGIGSKIVNDKAEKFVDSLIEELNADQLNYGDPEEIDDTGLESFENPGQYLEHLEQSLGFSIGNNGKLEPGDEFSYGTDALVGAVERMLADGLIRDKDVPLKVRDRNYYFLNYTEYKDESNTKEMERSREIYNSKYYIETNYSNKDKADILKYLVYEYF